MEADRADYVELGGELLAPSSHVVERISEWNVIQHNIGAHDCQHQDAADNIEPVSFPLRSEWVTCQHDLWCVVQSREIAWYTHE